METGDLVKRSEEGYRPSASAFVRRDAQRNLGRRYCFVDRRLRRAIEAKAKIPKAYIENVAGSGTGVAARTSACPIGT